jgi:hypothetical protein
VSDSTAGYKKSIAFYDEALASMKAARRMLFADFGMGFDDNLGTYTSLAGDQRGAYGIDVRTDREWRIFRRASAEHSTLESADPTHIGTFMTIGFIDSRRLENGELCAYVVENERDDFGNVDVTMVILSVDKEVKS